MPRGAMKATPLENVLPKISAWIETLGPQYLPVLPVSVPVVLRGNLRAEVHESDL